MASSIDQICLLCLFTIDFNSADRRRGTRIFACLHRVSSPATAGHAGRGRPWPAMGGDARPWGIALCVPHGPHAPTGPAGPTGPTVV